MMTTEMKSTLISRLRDELSDHEMYMMLAEEYENPCRQMLMDIAHEEKIHAHHLHEILERHDIEIPSDLEDKLKNTY